MTSPLLLGKFSTKLGDFNVRTIVQLCQLCCADPTLHSKLFRVVTYQQQQSSKVVVTGQHLQKHGGNLNWWQVAKKNLMVC